MIYKNVSNYLTDTYLYHIMIYKYIGGDCYGQLKFGTLFTYFLFGVDWQYNYQSHFIKAGRIYFQVVGIFLFIYNNVWHLRLGGFYLQFNV